MVGKERNFGLDVARAISILLVLAAHKFTLTLELGLVGVQIFFILSGFLIGQILIKDFKEGGDSSTVLKFWKRRWYRTLPMYYLVLVFKILLYGNPFGWKMIVYFFFLQANFVGISFFGVSWSLVVEEWFYIFLPLATLLFFRKGITPQKFLVFLVGFILFFFTARFLWNYYHKGVIIYQFDCLLLGVVLALLKVSYRPVYMSLNRAPVFLAGLAGVVAFTIMLGEIEAIPLYDPFHRVVWYLLISICIALMIPYLELSVLINQNLKRVKPLYLFFTWTSVLTYSIYLLHMEVFHIDFKLPENLNTLMQLAFLYAVSFIVYALYEHPVMSLRDEFSLSRYVKTMRSFSFKV